MDNKDGKKSKLIWLSVDVTMIKDFFLPGMVVIAAFILCVIFLYIGAQRNLTTLENILFQFIIFILSLAGSGWIGYIFSKKTNIQLYMSPFRRTCTLLLSIGRVKKLIEDSSQDQEVIIEKIHSIAIEQTFNAFDAISDWADLIGEEKAKETMTRKITEDQS